MCIELPVIMNLNPQSLYGRVEYLKAMIEEY